VGRSGEHLLALFSPLLDSVFDTLGTEGTATRLVRNRIGRNTSRVALPSNLRIDGPPTSLDTQ